MTKFLTGGAVVLALALALTACGGGGGYSEEPESTVAANAKTPVPEATASAPAKTAKSRPDADGNGVPDAVTLKGRLGDTLTLEGAGLHDDLSDHTKSKLRVTLQGMKGPFKGFDVADDRQLVGVVLKVKNVGDLKYDDPVPSGHLTGSSGESGKQTSLIPFGGKNPCDNPSLKLKKGQSQSVCIAFEVPKRDKPRTFEFQTDSGFGDTGLWKLH